MRWLGVNLVKSAINHEYRYSQNHGYFQVEERLTASILATVSQSEQKQMIGERLFPLVQEFQPTMAAKITGMLLELDNSELLHMLDQRDVLKDNVDGMLELLEEHEILTKKQRER